MKNMTKSIKLLIITLIVSIIVSAERLFSLFTEFDFTTKFYDDNFIPTIIYFTVIAVAIIIFIKARKLRAQEIYENTLDYIIDLFLMVIFGMIFVFLYKEGEQISPIQTVLHKVSLITSALSAINYAIALILRTKAKTITQLFNVFPSVFLSSELIILFTRLSGKANSYYMFPDVISTLILAYLILALGKATIPSASKGVKLISMSLISIIFISVSIIPDIILLIMQKFVFSGKEISIIALKALYLLSAINTVVKASKNTDEE